MVRRPLERVADAGQHILSAMRRDQLQAYRHGVDAITLIMLRMLFALPLFMVMAWWAGRGKPPLTRRDFTSSRSNRCPTRLS